MNIHNFCWQLHWSLKSFPLKSSTKLIQAAINFKVSRQNRDINTHTHSHRARGDVCDFDKHAWFAYSDVENWWNSSKFVYRMKGSTMWHIKLYELWGKVNERCVDVVRCQIHTCKRRYLHRQTHACVDLASTTTTTETIQRERPNEWEAKTEYQKKQQ